MGRLMREGKPREGAEMKYSEHYGQVNHKATIGDWELFEVQIDPGDGESDWELYLVEAKGPWRLRVPMRANWDLIDKAISSTVN